MVLCRVTAVWVITGHVGSPQTVWVGHSCPTRVSRNNPGWYWRCNYKQNSKSKASDKNVRPTRPVPLPRFQCRA